MSEDTNADYVLANIPLIGPGAGYAGYTPVPSWAVDDAIAVLQCHVARYSVGIIPDETGLTRLMIATCRTLAALVEANAARNDAHGAYEIVEQLDDFLGWPTTRQDLEAMRSRRVDPDIVDALLPLDARLQAKHPERGRPSARKEAPEQPAEGDSHGRETSEGNEE